MDIYRHFCFETSTPPICWQSSWENGFVMAEGRFHHKMRFVSCRPAQNQVWGCCIQHKPGFVSSHPAQNRLHVVPSSTKLTCCSAIQHKTEFMLRQSAQIFSFVRPGARAARPGLAWTTCHRAPPCVKVECKSDLPTCSACGPQTQKHRTLA